MTEDENKAMYWVVVGDDGILVSDDGFPNAILIFASAEVAKSAVAVYGGEVRHISEQQRIEWKQAIHAPGVCLTGGVPDEARFTRAEREVAWSILMPNGAFYTPQPNPSILSWLQNDRMRKLKEFGLKDTLEKTGHDLESLLFDTAEEAERFIAAMPGFAPRLFKAVEVTVNEFLDQMTTGGCRFVNRVGSMLADGRVPYNDYHLGLVDGEGQPWLV